jgi:kynurenine formamidase
MALPDRVPSYDELLAGFGGAPPGASWKVFGDGDQVGTLNFLTPARVAHAATLARAGRVFSLDYPVNAFEPFPSGTRHRMVHHTFANNTFHRDDYLDNFYLQATSQLDSLRHIGHPDHGFYQGARTEDVTGANTVLGIHQLADHGIVGRGVLLDVERFMAGRGTPLSPYRGDRITASVLDAVAKEQGVTVLPGDIVLVRTGWAGHYVGLTPEERVAYNQVRQCAGLAQEEATVRWLWDRQVSVIAADNLGVEASPRQRDVDRDFELPGQEVPAKGVDHNGMLHRPLIPLLGMPMGELWALDALAADCAADRVYEFLLVCKPLTVLGGAGSPPNVTVVK